jgi:hypothetical protein
MRFEMEDAMRDTLSDSALIKDWAPRTLDVHDASRMYTPPPNEMTQNRIHCD